MRTAILRWDRRFRLSVGARPRPQIGRRHEACCHGVLFDISPRSDKAFIATNPVIPRFILPKGLTRSPEQPIGGTGCRSLKPAHQRRRWHGRRDQNVDVVRHYDPRVQRIEQTPVFPVSDRIGGKQRDSGIGQPSWTGSCTVEFPILRDESVSWPRIGFQNLFPSYERQRSVQSPSDEQSGAFRLEVRQISSVFGNISNGQAKAPVPPLISAVEAGDSQGKTRVVGL